MRREIFGEVVDPVPRLGSQSRYTVPLSIAAHAAVVAALVIVPLMATDMMPHPRTVMDAFAAPAALPSPPPPPRAQAAPRASAPSASAGAAPTEAPATIAPEPATTGSVIGDPDGVPGGLPAGVVGSIGVLPDVPRLPPPPSVTEPRPVGGRIRPPAKLRHVPPVYPAIARQARVQGVVIVEAVIGIDGRVTQANVVGSKPLLDEAALAAVRQWVFTPTTLNGVPVPVVMTVRVNFTLH